MPRIFDQLAKNIKNFYHKAEDLIEEERELPLSQNLLNATIQRYVTDNVDALKDLHTDIYDDWCRLYATLDYKGLESTLSVDLRLVQMILDKNTQLLIFEQISETQVIHATFSSNFKKMLFNIFVYVYQRILNKDPLGMILSKLGVVEAKHGLLYLDLNKYLIKSDKVMRTLDKVNVNHAILREGSFVLKANINLQGIFARFLKSEPSSMDEALEADFTDLEAKEQDSTLNNK